MFFFFFNDTATTEIYTLSLHDALPISTSIISLNGASIKKSKTKVRKLSRAIPLLRNLPSERKGRKKKSIKGLKKWYRPTDRKSTRLNSSHLVISYAVFCLKKKKKKKTT